MYKPGSPLVTYGSVSRKQPVCSEQKPFTLLTKPNRIHHLHIPMPDQRFREMPLDNFHCQSNSRDVFLPDLEVNQTHPIVHCYQCGSEFTAALKEGYTKELPVLSLHSPGVKIESALSQIDKGFCPGHTGQCLDTLPCVTNGDPGLYIRSILESKLKSCLKCNH